MHRLHTLALQSSELHRASAATIRLHLLKTGATVLRNTRHVRVLLASHRPMRELLATSASSAGIAQAKKGTHPVLLRAR
jgi:hypothetical protein